MPRRSDPKNPLVINSSNEFSEVGYSTGGTPMPVNILASSVALGDPVNGTVNVKTGTLEQLGTVYSDHLAVITSAGAWGSVGYIAGGGTPMPVNLVAGVLSGANPSDGTLTQLGTLYAGSICVTSGTVYNVGTVYVLQKGTINTLQSGTLNTLNSGTLDTIGTLYAGSVCVTSGTVAANPTMGTLNEVYKVGTVYAGSMCITSGTVEITGALTGANPTDGTLTQLGTLYYLNSLGTIYAGSVCVTSGTVAANPTMGTLNEVYKVGTVYAGSICITSGTVASNPSMGTLNTVTQIGTLPVLGTLGTLYYLSGLGAGTLNEVYKVGTVYAGSICVTSGTVAANPTMGTLNVVTQVGTLPTLGTLGTLYYLNNVGTLYAGSICVTSGTIGVNAGTFIPAGLGTVRIDSGTIGVSAGTVIPAGLGTVRVDMGTIGISAGTVIPAGLGTMRVDMGTIGVSAGTLNNVYNVGTVYILQHGTLDMLEAGTLSMINAGTISTLNSGTLDRLGTLYAGSVCVSSGTLQMLNSGTVAITSGTLGTVNVYTKHDLHVYDAVGTLVTDAALAGQGTIAQTASKIIKVHYYKAQADGTFGFHFADMKPNGGTVDKGWYFLQREGVVSAFIPYPGYLFKTITAGSGLCIGTWPSIPCNGTLRVDIVYTDDDTS